MKSANSNIIDEILDERREGFIAAMSSAFDKVVNKYPAPEKQEETDDHIGNSADPKLIEMIVNLDYLK